MSCDWEGNRRSGVALAMHHVLKWFIGLRTERLSKGDERPTNISYWYGTLYRFYSAPQCSHCKRCTSNSVCLSVRPSACPSVTRRYCVKTTARSTVQFALLDSKMCLVLEKPKKNIPQGRPLPLKSWLELTYPS